MDVEVGGVTVFAMVFPRDHWVRQVRILINTEDSDTVRDDPNTGEVTNLEVVINDAYLYETTSRDRREWVTPTGGIVITRRQLETWAERPLTDEEIDRIKQGLLSQWVPEAVAALAGSLEGPMQSDRVEYVTEDDPETLRVAGAYAPDPQTASDWIENIPGHWGIGVYVAVGGWTSRRREHLRQEG